MTHAANYQEYDPYEISKRIAEHSYEKHVLEERRFEGRDNQKYGQELNINSLNDFAKHIESTIRDPSTRCFHAFDDRDVYYNKSTNTVVITDPHSAHGGTCLRDKTHEKYFNSLADRDNNFRSSLNLEHNEIVQGGFNKLYRDVNNDKEMNMTANQENEKETIQQEKEQEIKNTETKETKEKEMEDILKEARQLEEAAQARELEAQSRER